MAMQRAIARPCAVKVKIVTPRLEATRDFYVEVFGLHVVAEWDEPGAAGCILALSDPSGPGLVEVHRGDRVHDFSGLCLLFKVPDLYRFLRSTTPRLAVRGPQPHAWGSHQLFLTDPAGVPVVVFADRSA